MLKPDCLDGIFLKKTYFGEILKRAVIKTTWLLW